MARQQCLTAPAPASICAFRPCPNWPSVWAAETTIAAGSTRDGITLFAGALYPQRIPKPLVVDLKVDVDESYQTVAGLAHNGGKRKGAVCAYQTSTSA